MSYGDCWMNLDKYRQIFFDETSEELNSLESLVLETEKTPFDIDAINSIFRLFHRLKSSSAMMGLHNFSELSHQAEDLLSIIKEGKISADKTVISILLSVIDAMRKLINMAESGNLAGFQPDELISQLNEICTVAENKPHPHLNPLPEGEEISLPDTDLRRNSVPLIKDIENSLPFKGRVRVGMGSAPDEVSITQPHHGLNVIRIDESELNDLIDMAGDLISTISELDRITDYIDRISSNKEIQDVNHRINYVKRKADKLSINIHNRLLGTKMVPAGDMFERLKRVIHDLSIKTNKCIQVLINGAEIELDRAIVDKLFNPLLHIVRNAVDHGIEDDEVRIKSGKTPIAVITLSASLEGHFVTITVEDDGKGIDIEKVKNELIKRGIADKNEIDKISEKEIIDYLFIPGFSTKEEATDISGRGMGLDIVKENVKELKGEIAIIPVKAKGTTVKITIPQTLSIIRCLQVCIGKETYSIPSESIMEIIPFREKEFMTVKGRPLLLYRGSPVPVADIDNILNIKSDDKSISSHVIISKEEVKAAIPVSNIIGEQDILIKHLGQSFSGVVGILGVGILAGGRLSLIMDTDFLLRIYLKKGVPDDRIHA
ncbi:MAG: chemotaxis protein CheA [Nitrospirae bacterium]|nr:chemotaxis protein CheA [Nitrospirota bacterium]